MYSRILLFIICFSLFFCSRTWSAPSYSLPVINVNVPTGGLIRLAHFKPESSDRLPTIIFLQGRGMMMEYYMDMVEEFMRRGFEVFMFDWRGQGGSSRLILHTQKGHIDKYETYLQDLDYIVSNFVLPRVKQKKNNKLVIIGASMGAHIAMRYLFDKQEHFSAAILMVPMFEINTPPFPRCVARAIVKTACLLGFSDSYAIGYGDQSREQEIKKMTKYLFKRRENHDAIRGFAHNCFPMITAGPTYGWVEATFNSIEWVKEVLENKKIKIPLLIVNGSLDTTVNLDLSQGILDKLLGHLGDKCEIKTYENANHSLFELQENVERFWQDFSLFTKKVL